MSTEAEPITQKDQHPAGVGGGQNSVKPGVAVYVTEDHVPVAVADADHIRRSKSAEAVSQEHGD